MWKIENFSVTQILREINFGECRCCKTAVFVTVWKVENSQCENFMFLYHSDFTFYNDSRSAKSAISTLLESLILTF